MRVLVVAEFYPRASDPVLGIWAHRQTVAARDAGADVRVCVLHRPIPPAATPRRRLASEARRLLAQPRRAELDGIAIDYLPYLSPPRGRSYDRWGAWAAPALAPYLLALRRRFRYDLVHAHNAVPAGDAVGRARPGAPFVVSVHGGDVLYTALRHGPATVGATFRRAALVLANSSGIEDRVRALGAARTAVVHLGTDVPALRCSTPIGGPAAPRDGAPTLATTDDVAPRDGAPTLATTDDVAPRDGVPTLATTDDVAPRDGAPTLVTVAHLVARKRHADVLRALALLDGVDYRIIGDGPERAPLERLARELGVHGRVTFTGQLPHERALAESRSAHVFVMPSVDEAFGVAYVEAMAAGLPAVGCAGEPGPIDIAAAGPGLRLVPAGDVDALAAELRRLLSAEGAEIGRQARATVELAFTWDACGRATVAAYERALAP